MAVNMKGMWHLFLNENSRELIFTTHFKYLGHSKSVATKKLCQVINGHRLRSISMVQSTQDSNNLCSYF